MKHCDLGGGQGRAPELNLVERAIAETRVTGTGANLEGVVTRFGVQRVAQNYRLRFVSVEIDV